jgi:hypothetical protein
MIPGTPQPASIAERTIMEIPQQVYKALRVGLTETIRWNGQSYYLRALAVRKEPGEKLRFYMEVEI